MERQTLVHVGKIFKYQETIDTKIQQGNSSLVFVGQFKWNFEKPRESNEKKVAIKRVQLVGTTSIENDREVKALKQLKHPNIVRLFGVEDDQEFRYLIFEFCQANLEDLISKTYDGAMPDKIEGLFHIASGLEYIHENQLIHRDIKPENVLISVTENGKARLKIADFEFAKLLKDNETRDDFISEVKGTEIYMAAEILRLRNKEGTVISYVNCTTASDVFATGITFFRYLSRGLHPFGSGFDIEENIIDGKPINLIKENFDTETEWLHGIIDKMIQLDVKDRLPVNKVVNELKKRSPNLIKEEEANEYPPHEIIIVDGNLKETSDTVKVGHQGLKLDRRKLISKGLENVFEGYLNGEKVVVKRVQLLDEREYNDGHIHDLGKLHHLNVLRLIHHEDDLHFRYLVLEFYDTSLDQLFLEDNSQYMNSMPTDEQVLFQLAKGLDYIHSKKIVHENIKPQVTLISCSKPIIFKWEVTGIKRRPFIRNNINGEWKWLAPEVLDAIDSESCSTEISDVFSTGCVFFYFLTRGFHPFENSDGKIHQNIIEGNPTQLEKLIPTNHFANPLIKRMIEKNPAVRIQLSEVIEYLKPLQPKSQLSLMSYSHTNEISKGSFSKVYHVPEIDGKDLAVKIVNYIEGFFQEKVEKMKELNQANVIRLLFFDQDNFDWYFGMEWCETSLDRLYLPDGDPKKYSGPMPTIKDEEFCFQMANGLEYIHGRKLVHGSIKPSNILISMDNKVVQIKLSDFGWKSVSRRLDEIKKSEMSGFQNFSYWLAPEILEVINNKDAKIKFTEESDIFSTGNVLFYFSSQGRHLFGDDVHQVIQNILNEKRENLSAQNSNLGLFPKGLIRWMTAKKPESRPQLSEVLRNSKLLLPMPEKFKSIGEIKYSTQHVIGEKEQTMVFIGFFQSSSKPVAVKRFNNIDAISSNEKNKIDKEIQIFQQIRHYNIVKLFSSADEGPFLLLALEKCLTTLDAYCKRPLFYRGIVPMPSDCQVLFQMVEGLQFIHQKNIIHRDVKPANILISYDKPAVIKWADFGISRAVTTGSRTFTWRNLRETERWMAPELLVALNESDKVRGSFKCDIFALGCVFFFFLVPGKHPFGDNISNVSNVKKGNRALLDSLSKDHFAYDIVKEMTEYDANSRPELSKILKDLSVFMNSV